MVMRNSKRLHLLSHLDQLECLEICTFYDFSFSIYQLIRLIFMSSLLLWYAWVYRHFTSFVLRKRKFIQLVLLFFFRHLKDYSIEFKRIWFYAFQESSFIDLSLTQAFFINHFHRQCAHLTHNFHCFNFFFFFNIVNTFI